jgi:hypothetical protein
MVVQMPLWLCAGKKYAGSLDRHETHHPRTRRLGIDAHAPLSLIETGFRDASLAPA